MLNRLFVILALLGLTLVALSGCGGGSGGSSGVTLGLTLDGSTEAVTMDSNSSVIGTVQISASTALNEIEPSIKTDAPDVIIGSASTSNMSGVSYVTVSATNLTANTRIVNVWAEFDGIVSNMIQISVLPGVQTGSLALAISNTTPIPGESVTATAQYTNTSTTADLGAIAVSIVSSNPSVVPNVTATTDSTGKAIATITIPVTAPQGTAVSLVASASPANGAVISATPVTVTIGASNSLALAMSETAEFPRTATAGSPSSSGTIVVQGNKITFTGPQGIIPQQPITLSIDRIDNWSAGDSVLVNGSFFSGLTPAGSITVQTDSSGTAQIPTSITVIMPAAPATAGQSLSHVFVIYWRATTTYGGLTYIATGSTLVTGTTTAE